jgi:hypothetical protein
LYDGQAFEHYRAGLTLATELNDEELICYSYALLANEYERQGDLATARDAITTARERLSNTRSAITPLKGNIYLRVAAIKGQLAGSNQQEQNEAKALQDKAASMLYKGDVENDSTFWKFNLAAVNHEKAKLMLQFALQSHSEKQALPEKESNIIQARLSAALDAVPPDLIIWKMYFYLTEARLYIAQHDIEASAKAGREALDAARTVASLSGVNDVKALYVDLSEKGGGNPYVDNLGVELGMFS